MYMEAITPQKRFGCSLKSRGPGRYPLDQEGGKDHGDGRVAGNAEGEHGNEGSAGRGIIGRFRGGHALKGSLTELLRFFGNPLLDRIRKQGSDNGSAARQKPHEKSDSGAAHDRPF